METIDIPRIQGTFYLASKLRTLGDIYIEERQRHNKTLDILPQPWIEQHWSCEAYWVFQKPIDAFRHLLDETCWEYTDREIIERYPFYHRDVRQVTLRYEQNVLVWGDASDPIRGALIVDTQRYHKNEKMLYRVSEDVTRSILQTLYADFQIDINPHDFLWIDIVEALNECGVLDVLQSRFTSFLRTELTRALTTESEQIAIFKDTLTQKDHSY